VVAVILGFGRSGELWFERRERREGQGKHPENLRQLPGGPPQGQGPRDLQEQPQAQAGAGL